MTYFAEIRSTVHRKGPPKLVPLAEVANYSGFRSVFAYDETVANLIREQGGTQGLRGQPVYSDVLLLETTMPYLSTVSLGSCAVSPTV